MVERLLGVAASGVLTMLSLALLCRIVGLTAILPGAFLWADLIRATPVRSVRNGESS